MREYGQIQCSFWSDPDVQSVSNDAKLIATYLLSGPHSNGLGCYRIPDGYIQADLGMTPQTISKGFAELFNIGFCLRCDATNFVVMPKFLKWNQIANPKVGSAREKEFKTIPDKFSHYSVLCLSILEHGNHLSNGFETVLKGYAIQDPILPDHTKPNQDRIVDPPKEPPKEKPKTKKGSRLSLLTLPDDWETFCRENRPDLQPHSVFEQFKDYWASVPGQKGVKLDWLATWRNWVRNQKGSGAKHKRNDFKTTNYGEAHDL